MDQMDQMDQNINQMMNLNQIMDEMEQSMEQDMEQELEDLNTCVKNISIADRSFDDDEISVDEVILDLINHYLQGPRKGKTSIISTPGSGWLVYYEYDKYLRVAEKYGYTLRKLMHSEEIICGGILNPGWFCAIEPITF